GRRSGTCPRRAVPPALPRPSAGRVRWSRWTTGCCAPTAPQPASALVLLLLDDDLVLDEAGDALRSALAADTRSFESPERAAEIEHRRGVDRDRPGLQLRSHGRSPLGIGGPHGADEPVA